MTYITLSDLSNTIRRNLYKIPRDIDCIIGVPRSGMIAASIISSYLNIPLIDVNSFAEGLAPTGGDRLRYFINGNTKRALVIDDTVFAGRSMNEAKAKLAKRNDYSYIYACVFLEGPGEAAIDFCLEDIRHLCDDNIGIVLYEWNIFQHHSNIMSRVMFDMDGVFNVDPPDERDEENYLEYIKNAPPLFIPRTKIDSIATFRLEKNREITKQWLNKYGIKYNELFMFNANSWDERNNTGISPGRYKAACYMNRPNTILFIESNNQQAIEICQLTKKSVYCVETNTLYR